MSETTSRSTSASEAATAPRLGQWCLPVGLFGLLLWLIGGLLLETLHALKAVLYVEDDLRREMWTLAHAHGTLLSALCLLMPLLPVAPRLAAAWSRRADRLLASGALLLPFGFFLGGTWHLEGDPGPGILLVPVGALAFGAGVAVLLLAALRDVRRAGVGAHRAAP